MSNRRARGEDSVYFDASRRLWRGQIALPPGPNGRRRAKTVSGHSRSEVVDKLRIARQDIDAGVRLMAREVPLVQDWLRTWLGVAARTCKDSTLASYEVDVNQYAIPSIGAIRLDRLTAEDVERLYDQLYDRGLSTSTVSGLHRTLRAAFNEAVRRSWMVRNPVKNARPRKVTEREIVPLSLEETQRVIEVAKTHRNAARWTVALALGLRQGEASGLRWGDVDLDRKTIHVRRALAPLRWQHGCAPTGGTASCGELSGAKCPQRKGGGLKLVEPKSTAGTRLVSVPESLVAELASHRIAQAAERLKVGADWVGPPPGSDECFVFTNSRGGPIGPKQDWLQWSAILDEAGVDHRRVHDARHTAATFMLVLGVESRVVMATMGWSSMAMIQRYQHVVPQLRDEVAGRMESLLFTPERNRESGR